MANALVLGGSRFIGFHLTQELLRQGYQVSHFRRGQTPLPAPLIKPITLFKGDRSNSADLRAPFARDFDVVFDLSGYRPEQVLPILSSHHARIGHYIFCSTSSVLLRPIPVPYHEGSPAVPAHDTHGGPKRAIELALLDCAGRSAMGVTIFRPQGVIGKYDGAQAAFAFAGLKARTPIQVSQAVASARLNMLDVDDLVQAFVAAARLPVARGKIYNLANNDPQAFTAFTGLCARVSGMPDPGVEVADHYPCSWWPDHDLVADNRRAREELGVVFRPLETTLQAAWRGHNRSRWQRARDRLSILLK